MTRDVRNRDGLPAADQEFLVNIENHGWVVTKVFRSTGESGPEFAYSTGLFYTHQHPEILIFGLDLEIMHGIISNVGDAVKLSTRFEVGKEYQDIFARCGCQFRIVDPAHYKAYLGWSIWFYEDYRFGVLQCFWPDRDGHYPWDPACTSEITKLQPMLFKPS